MTRTATMIDAYPADLGGIDCTPWPACVDECAARADMHEHCKVCAEACRACERACTDLLDALG